MSLKLKRNAIGWFYLLNTNKYASKRTMTRPAGKDYSKQARGFRDVVARYPNG
jgi:hypothetical protein